MRAMRAAVFTQAGRALDIVEGIEIDDPRPGEVLVRIRHCGVCHSDLHYARVAGNRSVQQARKLTALGACPQPAQAAAGRIIGERCSLVKPPHNFGSRVARQP